MSGETMATHTALSLSSTTDIKPGDKLFAPDDENGQVAPVDSTHQATIHPRDRLLDSEAVGELTK